MKNSEYWEKRIANNTWETYNSLEEKNRALLEMYQEASLSISDELYRVAEKMKTSTPTISDMHKFNRLTNLQKNMENIIRELGENVEKFGKENMIEGFKDIYSNVMAQLGITEFDMVPKKIMEEMMKRPWQGGTFSERLWKNTQVLAMNLNDIVTNGIIQGKTVTEMAIQLNNAMNTGFNVSHRLVRTETMHYLNESAFKGYEDAGCEEVELWAAADERTCEVCGAKHGTKYKIKDRPILPLHANCRCTYLPVIENSINNKTFEEEKTSKKGNYNSVNWDVVSSKEYRDKFKSITDNEDLNNLLCEKARDILKHRNNTNYEDFYLFDSIDGKVKAAQTHSREEFVVNYNKEICKTIDKNSRNRLISMHNHSTNNPPSGGDWDSIQENGYKKGIIVCHNGEVFTYSTGKQTFNGKLFDLYVDKYSKQPYNLSERESFIKVLEEFKARYNIKYEVL